MKCPYCNSLHLSDSKSVLAYGAEVLAAMGIKVPSIRQCLDCKATFSEEVFDTESPRWVAQRTMTSA